MKTKNIFKMLAFAMLMPAMMLTTACSSDDDIVNNENNNKKGYEIPLTINATRQDTDVTRATYNSTTNKLEFATGDQLYVWGSHSTAGNFSGTLSYESVVSEGTGKFSGTITTTGQYPGTAIELLNSSTFCCAAFLPKDYTDNHYINIPSVTGQFPGFTPENAFALSKATAVEQFSREMAYEDAYNDGVFALAPQNAILNFTITGLTPNGTTSVTFRFPHYGGQQREIYRENVPVDGDGNATFAIGAGEPFTDLSAASLTVNYQPITLVSSSTPLVPGKIYNITRSAPSTSN